jgi:hypothetical protein
MRLERSPISHETRVAARRDVSRPRSVSSRSDWAYVDRKLNLHMYFLYQVRAVKPESSSGPYILRSPNTLYVYAHIHNGLVLSIGENHEGNCRLVGCPPEKAWMIGSHSSARACGSCDSNSPQRAGSVISTSSLKCDIEPSKNACYLSIFCRTLTSIKTAREKTLSIFAMKITN